MNNRYAKTETATRDAGYALDNWHDTAAEYHTQEIRDAATLVASLDSREQLDRVNYDIANRRRRQAWDEMVLERDRWVDGIIEMQEKQFVRMVEQNDTIIGLLERIVGVIGSGR